MKNFTLTITNNETGEVDTAETNAIIAGVDEDDGSRTILFTACNILEYSNAMYAALRAILEAKKSNRTAYEIAKDALMEEGVDDE